MRRLRRGGTAAGATHWQGVLVEKILFLVPAAVIALCALKAQAEAGALRGFAEHPISLRIGQAFYGIMFYLWKTLWPTGLAPLYEQRPEATPLDVANVASAETIVATAKRSDLPPAGTCASREIVSP